MTDYELLSTFHAHASSANAVYMGFAGVLFAYLIAGYFVAAKLSKAMALLLTVLFSIVVFQEAASMVVYLNDAFRLAPEMRTRESLQFHGVVQGGDLPILFFNITFIFTAAISYIGALIFFFFKDESDLKK